MLCLCLAQISGFCQKRYQFVDAKNFPVPDSERIELCLAGKKLPEWMTDVIAKEVQPFAPFTVQELDDFLHRTEWTLLHFRIRGGKVWFRCNEDSLYQVAVDFARAFQRLVDCPEVDLKDGDFLLDFADTVSGSKSPFPVLCICKYPASNFIMIPDWFSLSSQKNVLMDTVDKGNRAYPWESKVDKAFWIGSPNSPHLERNEEWKTKSLRGCLVNFSLAHPDMLWARFSSFSRQEKRLCSEMRSKKTYRDITAPRIEPDAAMHYKYQIDVDGWGCGYHRCFWTLYSNCVAIKQNEGGSIQWYYAGLVPFVHYVPYKPDCCDLESRIRWLREHDDKAQEIAQSGRRFAQDFLTTDMCYLYFYEVLLRLNKLNLSI